MEQRRRAEARGAIWFASERPRTLPALVVRRRPAAPRCRGVNPSRLRTAAQCVLLLVVSAFFAVSLGWHTRFEASTHLVGRLRSIVRPAPSLLIMVHSAPGHAAERDAMRRAWLHSAADVIRVHTERTRTLFVVPFRSRPDGGDDAEAQLLLREVAALERERALHSDLLLIPTSALARDTLSPVALEILSALRWAVGVAPLRGTSAPPYGWRSVLITRDDTFVNTPYLAAALGALPSARFIMGHLPPRRTQSLRQAAPHPGNAAFVVSRDVVRSVVVTSASMPLLSTSSGIGTSFGVRRRHSVNAGALDIFCMSEAPRLSCPFVRCEDSQVRGALCLLARKHKSAAS